MWREHLRAYLDAVGGIAGDDVTDPATLPPPRATQPYVPDTTPRRDDRFTGVHQSDFPPQTAAMMGTVALAARGSTGHSLALDQHAVQRDADPWH